MEIQNKFDFIDADIIYKLPKLSADDIVIIHVNEIYDGPLDGICKWKTLGDYYFYSIDQLKESKFDEKFPNKFILLKLNQRQTQITLEEMRLFLEWKSGRIEAQDFTKLRHKFVPETIKKEQIIGWFNAIESHDMKSNFIESYFLWKEKNQC